MRKIFSAALALVCIWFATPAFANCNLTQRIINKTYTGVGSSVVDEHALISGITYKENTPYTITIDVEPSNITFSEDGNLLWWSIKYTDGSSNYTGVTTSNYNNGRVSVTTSSNKTVESISGLSNHERWTGGTLKVSNLQIEEGTTATPYQPYNPLCATCDGTIVNYTSATGTGVQNGTPTPTNPIEPTFYKQGNMVLRKVGDVADSYDATTGKITRRVGVKVFDGTEDWRVYSANAYATNPYFSTYVTDLLVGGTPDTKLFCNMLTSGNIGSSTRYKVQYTGGGFFVQPSNDILTVENFKLWLAQQYAAGTPVTVWYPLETETTEDWPASYCETPIKIATTKYNESAFSPLNTALANAISVVDSVVSNTITQAASIATLQAQKQTRPNDIADDNEKCPAGKKCLLVEDASGVPHWYEIVTGRLPDGYTELQYIESTGTQYIDTGITLTNDVSYVANIGTTKDNILGLTGIVWQSGLIFQIRYYSNGEFNINDGFGLYEINTLYNVGFNVDKARFCKDDLCVTKTRDIVNNSTRIKTGVYDMIASLKIYNDGTLVRNMIPAKRNTDGVVGMYDTVSGEFFENKGTGEFIGGQPVFN